MSENNEKVESITQELNGKVCHCPDDSPCKKTGNCACNQKFVPGSTKNK